MSRHGVVFYGGSVAEPGAPWPTLLPLFARTPEQAPAVPVVVPRVDPPFRAASSTSRAAAEAIKPKRASQAERILAFLRERGDEGATIEEISLALKIKESSVCARLGWDLIKVGAVEQAERERLTTSGLPAKVCLAKPKAAVQ